MHDHECAGCVLAFKYAIKSYSVLLSPSIVRLWKRWPGKKNCTRSDKTCKLNCCCRFRWLFDKINRASALFLVRKKNKSQSPLAGELSGMFKNWPTENCAPNVRLGSGWLQNCTDISLAMFFRPISWRGCCKINATFIFSTKHTWNIHFLLSYVRRSLLPTE